MPTDPQLADLCIALYSTPAALTHTYFGPSTDDVCVGVQEFDSGETAIVFRGSTTPQDWFRDFESIMLNDPKLGGVEQGFYAGLSDTLKCLEPHLTGPVSITGHSLGAARALIFGALMAVNGNPPAKITVFGSPRPGGAKLRQILSGIPIHSYANFRDYVTDVPFPLLPLLPYEHPCDQIAINEPPNPGDPWGLLAHHHMELYRAGLVAA